MLAPEASAFRSLFAKALGESRTGREPGSRLRLLPQISAGDARRAPPGPARAPHPGVLAPGGPGTGCGGAGGWRRVKSRLCSPAPALLALPRHRRGRAAFTRPPPSRGHAEISYTTPPLRCSHAQQNLLPLPLSPPSLPPFFFFLLFLIVLSSGRARHQGQEGMSPVPRSLPAPWGSAGWQQPQDL